MNQPSSSHLSRKTKKLHIRPLTRQDYESWKDAYSSMLPRKNEWDTGNRSPEELSRSNFLKLLKSQRENQSSDRVYDLGIFTSSDMKLIGIVSLMDVIRGLFQNAFLGLTIFNKYWQSGYGKAATEAILDIAFNDLGLHRLEAGVEPRNIRCLRGIRAFGFRKEGRKKRAVYLRGEWRDLMMYSLTCEDYGIEWRGAAHDRPR
ncbi:MAG TPA: GNAT family protein [Thermoanaerobaculia bacterium]|nr:GNAT family protein [Thermoanaerobaculia bacterium]